jgi:hypothetical protein
MAVETAQIDLGYPNAYRFTALLEAILLIPILVIFSFLAFMSLAKDAHYISGSLFACMIAIPFLWKITYSIQDVLLGKTTENLNVTVTKEHIHIPLCLSSSWKIGERAIIKSYIDKRGMLTIPWKDVGKILFVHIERGELPRIILGLRKIERNQLHDYLRPRFYHVTVRPCNTLHRASAQTLVSAIQTIANQSVEEVRSFRGMAPYWNDF